MNEIELLLENWEASYDMTLDGHQFKMGANLAKALYQRTKHRAGEPGGKPRHTDPGADMGEECLFRIDRYVGRQLANAYIMDEQLTILCRPEINSKIPYGWN